MSKSTRGSPERAPTEDEDMGGSSKLLGKKGKEVSGSQVTGETEVEEEGRQQLQIMKEMQGKTLQELQRKAFKSRRTSFCPRSGFSSSASSCRLSYRRPWRPNTWTRG